MTAFKVDQSVIKLMEEVVILGKVQENHSFMALVRELLAECDSREEFHEAFIEDVITWDARAYVEDVVHPEWMTALWREWVENTDWDPLVDRFWAMKEKK